MFEKQVEEVKHRSWHVRKKKRSRRNECRGIVKKTRRMVKKVAAWSKIESPMGQKIVVWSKNFSLHGQKKTRHSQKLGHGLVLKQIAAWQKKE